MKYDFTILDSVVDKLAQDHFGSELYTSRDRIHLNAGLRMGLRKLSIALCKARYKISEKTRSIDCIKVLYDALKLGEPNDSGDQGLNGEARPRKVLLRKKRKKKSRLVKKKFTNTGFKTTRSDRGLKFLGGEKSSNKISNDQNESNYDCPSYWCKHR